MLFWKFLIRSSNKAFIQQFYEWYDANENHNTIQRNNMSKV